MSGLDRMRYGIVNRQLLGGVLLAAFAVLIVPPDHCRAAADDSLEQRIQQLSRGEPAERRLAARKLRDLGVSAAPAVPQLTFAVRSEDRLVRRYAVAALANIGPQADVAVPRLVELLTHPDLYLRQYATIALGRIGIQTPETVRALTNALKDDHRYVRRAAGGALAAVAVSDDETVTALVTALEDPDEQVRWNAAWALVESTGNPLGLGAALTQVLGMNQDVRVGLPRPWLDASVESDVMLVNLRDAAVARFAKTGGTAEPVVTELAALIEADMVRNADLFPVIASVGSEAQAVVPVLIRLLEGMPSASDSPGSLKNPSDPQIVLETLCAIGPNAGRAIPAIERFLISPNPPVVLAAIAALEAIDSPAGQESVPALLKLVADAEAEPRAAAESALDRLRPTWREETAARQAGAPDLDGNQKDTLSELGVPSGGEVGRSDTRR